MTEKIGRPECFVGDAEDAGCSLDSDARSAGAPGNSLEIHSLRHSLRGRA